MSLPATQYTVFLGGPRNVFVASEQGENRILKNIFYGFLNGEDPSHELFDDYIRTIVELNAPTSRSTNTIRVLEYLKKEVDRIGNADLNTLDLDYNKKKFTVSIGAKENKTTITMLFDKFNFSLEDLTNDSKINELLGFGEYTDEFETLTSGEDISQEVVEDIKSRVNNEIENNFPSMFKFLEKSLVLNTENFTSDIYFDDDNFTRGVLREMSPSNLTYSVEGKSKAWKSAYPELPIFRYKKTKKNLSERDNVEVLIPGYEYDENKESIVLNKGMNQKELANLFVYCIFNNLVGGGDIKTIFHDSLTLSTKLIDIEVSLPTTLSINKEDETMVDSGNSKQYNSNNFYVASKVVGDIRWTSKGLPTGKRRYEAIGVELPDYFPKKTEDGETREIISRGKELNQAVDLMEDFFYNSVANYLQLKEDIEEALMEAKSGVEEEE